MFVNLLNHNEKKHFWNLINYVARCDGNVSTEEQQMLHQFQQEVDLGNIEITSNNFDEIVDELKGASSVVYH